MLYLIVSNTAASRRLHIEKIVESISGSEVLLYDETYGALADLEQYFYPSLFTSTPPIVQVKFMVASDTDIVTAPFLKKLRMSSTIFLFEEMTVPSPLITLFKKSGASVHEGEKIPTVKKEGDIFMVTKALTAPDKKSRWMAYRASLETHAIEAIIGILYWKIRDMVVKNPKEKKKYLSLYEALLHAHALAWETGAPLELMIEKVILMQS